MFVSIEREVSHPMPHPRPGDHRQAALYRMRIRHLQLLASLLGEDGLTAVVTEPYGMPMLHVARSTGSQQRIVATLGYGEVDWFRWVHGDYIAPCAEPQVAAEAVCRQLRVSAARSDV